MSGMAFRITSPSVSTRKLSTPWVDGCCGPKLMSISSLFRSTRRRTSFDMALSSRPSGPPAGRTERGGRGRGRRRMELLVLGDAHQVDASKLDERVLAQVGDAVEAAGLLVVLAQRVADPVVGEHDPAQVGVAGEGDAEEVVDLPLQPVGGLPDALDRVDHRAGPVEL